MSDEREELLKSVVRKIRLQRGVHDFSESRLSRYLTSLKVINVLFSSFITLIVFADFGLIEKLLPSISGLPVQLTIGVLSFFLFVINVLADVFHLEDKKVSHLNAIQQYTTLLNEIKNEYAKTAGNIEATRVTKFNEQYLEIAKSVIKIEGRKFTIAYNEYLKKRCYKLALERQPFSSKTDLMKASKSLVVECTKIEGRI